MPVSIGVIGGSRAYDLLRQGAIRATECASVPTPFGDSSPIGRARFGDHEVVFVSRHGERGYELSAPFVNYRANTYALKDAGVDRVIAWSGPGAIDETLQVGQFVVPDDLLDETHGRCSTFFHGTGLGFIRVSPVFCPEVAEALAGAVEGMEGLVRRGGTYVCTRGPRLETPAEIRKCRILGGDIVGMTLAPEAFLARELEMCYAAVCYITNYAEGVRPSAIDRARLFEGLATREETERAEAAVAMLPAIVAGAAERLAGRPRTCTCGEAMRRYKLRGIISEDWKTWIRP